MIPYILGFYKGPDQMNHHAPNLKRAWIVYLENGEIRIGSPLSPAPFPSRAAHGWRRGSRAGRGGARPPRAALGTDRVNDPSAGSPTETLLRLLLPLNDQVCPTFQRLNSVARKKSQSEGFTKPFNR